MFQEIRQSKISAVHHGKVKVQTLQKLFLFGPESLLKRSKQGGFGKVKFPNSQIFEHASQFHRNSRNTLPSTLMLGSIDPAHSVQSITVLRISKNHPEAVTTTGFLNHVLVVQQIQDFFKLWIQGRLNPSDTHEIWVSTALGTCTTVYD